jgi:hypothetical protein
VLVVGTNLEDIHELTPFMLIWLTLLLHWQELAIHN